MKIPTIPSCVRTATLALIVFAAACTSSKDASEDNFEEALNEMFERKGQCFDVSGIGGNTFIRDYFQFPLTIAPNPMTGVAHGDKEAIGHLNAFVDAGLLTRTEGPVEWKGVMGNTRQVEGLTYDLTDEGREAYRGDGNGRFCYGVARVEEITNFTVPSDNAGMKLTTVQYTYSVQDLADWLDHEYFAELRKAAEASEDQPVRDSIVLVLTEKGWKPYLENLPL